MFRPRFQSLARFDIGVRNSKECEDHYNTKYVDHGDTPFFLWKW